MLIAGRCGSDVVAGERKVDIMGLPTEGDAPLVLFAALGSQ